MDFLVLLLHLHPLLLLAALEVPRGHCMLTTICVFGLDGWELQVAGFVQVCVLGPIPDGGSGEPLLLSRVVKAVTFPGPMSFSYYKFFT